MRFSESGAVLRARTRWVSIVSEAAPRRIQVEPERRAEPTRRVFRNVQHTVSSQAHEFGAVPLQEPAGALADSDGVREQPKALSHCVGGRIEGGGQRYAAQLAAPQGAARDRRQTAAS